MKTQNVKLYAAQQLHRLQALPDNQRRAELAKLRRGIGHAPVSYTHLTLPTTERV